MRLLVLVVAAGSLAGCIKVSVRRTPEASPALARGDTVERLAPEAIPAGEAFASSLTPDGRTLFFTWANAERTRLRVMRTRWEGGRWTAPEPTSVADVPRSMDPHVAPDGRALWYSSPRRREAALDEPGGDWDTWVVDLSADGTPTGAPRQVAAPANTGKFEMYPSTTRDGALYYGVFTNDTSERRTVHGIWRADGRGAARRLDGPVNAAGASNPFVSADERLLIFSSDRPGTVGRGDLWLSVRAADGTWGEPRNLGPLVNGTDTEFCPQLSPDGRHFLFSRTHFDGDRRTGSDVYVVRVSAVPVLREALAR